MEHGDGEGDPNPYMEENEDPKGYPSLDAIHMIALHKGTIVRMLEVTSKMKDTLRKILKYLVEDIKK